MTSPGMGDYDMPMRNVQDLDVTVLAFAQWLSEMRSRSSSSLQQMLAEMGIIRNGITSNNTDLTEFKRNTATVQQQMQSQISDLRDKLTDAYTEIANLKKTKSQFEQEVHAEYQSLSEQLQFKTLELETLKKAYAHTHQQLQQQIIQLQTEVNELRLRGDDAHRQTHLTYEQSVNKVSEVEMAAQYANNEMKRLRSDHDQAIANLAENMNRWKDTLGELSKEFHDLKKVMTVNHQRIQSSLWDVQAASGITPGTEGGGRMESAGNMGSSPPARQAVQPAQQQVRAQPQSPPGQAQAQARRPTSTSMQPPYPGAPQQGPPQPGQPQGPYMMR
jgi:myosin heavy subunit|mmetsp:Transcript_10231/g.30389  ORF Transcript_10231/g.30389 Transcript_10231/m.30389 type:complete len:331 (-) Transcript_10231:303-1295(-)